MIAEARALVQDDAPEPDSFPWEAPADAARLRGIADDADSLRGLPHTVLLSDELDRVHEFSPARSSPSESEHHYGARMRHDRLMAVPVVLGLSLLVGCASVDAADPAVPEWMAEQASMPLPDGAGAGFSAMVSVDESKESGEGDSVSFNEPVTLDRVEFDCFGDATMTGMITLDLASGGSTSASQSLACDQGTQVLALPSPRGTEVVAVRFEAYDSSVESAWQVVIFGQQ
ncbi:hypothetical protein GCM10022219_06550 [Microbacterium oryzae]|uniref:Uncharacterized protein n=1 Tax=Microbacterium oryzae TaxID=743009 RepID=A0A6I6E616_9MICO|nr:hypothetical protein [Microbacterium oryzae]QGU26758.1 hypothetical protein D7D94_03065 [Microbacterium oryzae]